MIDTVVRLFALLRPAERGAFFALLGLMLLEAAFEIAGLYLVPAYVGLLAYPERVESLLPPAWTGPTADRVILWSSLAVVGFYALKLVLNTWATALRVRYAQNLALRLSHRLFASYLSMPMERLAEHNTARFQRNLNNESIQLAERVLLPLMETLTNLTVILAVAAALLYFLPWFALSILTLFLAGAALVVWAMQPALRRSGVEVQALREDLLRHVSEGMGCIREIRLLGRVRRLLDRFRDDFEALMVRSRHAQVMQTRFVPGWIELATIAALATVVVALFREGRPSAEVLQVMTVCAVGLARLKGALSGLMSHYSVMQHHRAALDVVREDLDRFAVREDGADPDEENGAERVVPVFRESLVLEDVHYRYRGSRHEVLSGVDLCIRRGEAVGLMGPSGAGKSTLIDLLLGFLEPDRGRILIDGTPLRERLSAWQRSVGYVPQMLMLVDGTLRENIALGLPPEAIDEDALARAVALARLDAVVDRLPRGLDTRIGERGVRLSGGQRQRVVIARALYHDPEVLVFDEGTSALDSETEREIIRAIGSLKGDRTILMVAHRAATLAPCDRRMRIRNGRIEPID